MNVPAPRTGVGPPAALATAWTLFLLLPSAGLFVAARPRPLPAVAVLVAVAALAWRGVPAVGDRVPWAALGLLGVLGAAALAAGLATPPAIRLHALPLPPPREVV